MIKEKKFKERKKNSFNDQSIDHQSIQSIQKVQKPMEILGSQNPKNREFWKTPIWTGIHQIATTKHDHKHDHTTKHNMETTTKIDQNQWSIINQNKKQINQWSINDQSMKKKFSSSWMTGRHHQSIINHHQRKKNSSSKQKKSSTNKTSWLKKGENTHKNKKTKQKNKNEKKILKRKKIHTIMTGRHRNP